MRVAFFTGKHPGIQGWYSVAVKWWTRGDFSHCELIESYNPDGSVNVWSSAYLDKGVRRKTITLDPTQWRVLELPVGPDVFANAIQWFKDHNGQPYDLRGMFGIAVRRLPYTRNKWYCSESIAEALGYVDSWRIDPAMLWVCLVKDSGQVVALA